MENLQCLFSDLPWDIFIFFVLVGLLLWWIICALVKKKMNPALKKLSQTNDKLTEEIEEVKSKAEEELIYLRSKTDSLSLEKAAAIESLKKEIEDYKRYTVNLKRELESIRQGENSDDLKVIKGVGPKIEQLLNEADIFTYEEMAATTVEKLREVLDGGGERYFMHDPSTWPKQAEMAKEERWDELTQWQKKMNNFGVEKRQK